MKITYPYKNITDNLLEDLSGEPVETLKWIHYGYIYKKGYVICTAVEEKLPVFEEIVEIFMIRENIFFVTKKLQVQSFVNKLNSFKVEPADELSITHLNLLFYREPYNIHQTQSNALYIVPKYAFVIK